MRHIIVLLTTTLLGTTLCACDDSKPASDAPKGGDTAAATAEPTGDVKPAADKPADKAELEEVKNEGMGYTIKIPKGAEQSMNDANGGMYTKDTMIIKVDPLGVETKTADDLLRAVNTGDGKVDKKEEGDVFVVVVEKEASPLNIYAGPKGAKFAAHCMAEPSDRDLATEICTSIRAAK